MNTRVIVAGGRDFNDIQLMKATIKGLVQAGQLDNNCILICGMARGADMLAYTLWTELYHNPVERFPADWNTHGKPAGFIRNGAMAEKADLLVAFWDGQSRGTKHMIDTMQRMGKPVHIIRY